MQLNTKHFGLIDVEESKIIQFPEGVPGFEGIKRFALLDKSQDDVPFQWLQAIDNSELAFVVIDPFFVKGDYEVNVDDKEIEILDIKDIKSVMVLSIVVIPENIKEMTANLRAPILINLDNRVGKQVVLDKVEYEVRYSILEGLKQDRR
jgi:flagellar assembly factor FliW